jgi:hypothetical protein
MKDLCDAGVFYWRYNYFLLLIDFENQVTLIQEMA